MGPVSRRELGMAPLALLALALWIFGGPVIDPTLVAMIAVSLMLVTGIVSWDDIQPEGINSDGDLYLTSEGSCLVYRYKRR